MNLQKFLFKIIFFFYPNYCANCGNILNTEDPNCFCSNCWNTIKIIKNPACKKCGKPVITSGNICFDCKKRKSFFYNEIKCVGLYEDVLKEAIHLYKYNQRWKIGYDLAYLALKNVPPEYITQNNMIVPVPLTKEKLYERGFSQTFLIAKKIGKSYNLPVYPDVLLKIKETPPQSTLTKEKRLVNLVGCFDLNPKYKNIILNKNILLLDDVYTTGATVTECSKVLKSYGAKKINVLTIARGI